MARKQQYVSLDHELNSSGYLSLNKALAWLKQYHPVASISYPTALKLLKDNRIMSIRIGDMHRISREELMRFVKYGNADPADVPERPEETVFPPIKPMSDEDPYV